MIPAQRLLTHSIDARSSYSTPCGRRPVLGVRLGRTEMQTLERLCADLGCSKSLLARNLICFGLKHIDVLIHHQDVVQD
jgi:hypothetical protein